MQGGRNELRRGFKVYLLKGMVSLPFLLSVSICATIFDNIFDQMVATYGLVHDEHA